MAGEHAPIECRIRKRKRHGGHGLWGAYEVDRDDHGTWLYTPERSRYVGTNPNGTIDTCFAGQPDEPGLDVMQLVPPGDAWWIAHWTIYRGNRTLSIDICTPTTQLGNEWCYVDLELDLYRSDDGSIGVFDEDEFDEACASGVITETERDICLRTAEELNERIQRSDVVFDDLAWLRLDQAIATGLPPITDPAAT